MSTNQIIIHLLTILGLLLFVAGIRFGLKSKYGRRVGNLLPEPFWIYFVSIIFGQMNVFPQESVLYQVGSLWLLPAALFLMLVGTPLAYLMRIGPKALLAMMIATITMILSLTVSFAIFGRWMPEDGWQMAGAMMGTWIGGSANMLAVKEVLGLSDSALGPLILTDTFLSYGWFAILMAGVAFEKKFNKHIPIEKLNLVDLPSKQMPVINLQNILLMSVAGISIAGICLFIGDSLQNYLSFLSMKAWAILLATTVAVALAGTKFSRLEDWGASSTGSFMLYMVLAIMGLQTKLPSIGDAGIFMAFGLMGLLGHGILTLLIGRQMKIPLFLLATASQANVGGPVSAPIVAGVYRPGAAPLGVLMALFGAIFGTYLGSLGGFLFRAISGS